MNIEQLFLKFALLGAEWVLWLLVILSILSVAVMIERWQYYRQRRVNMAALLDAVREAARGGELDEEFATSQALPAQVARRGIAEAENGAQAAAEAMNSAKAHGKQGYENYLVVLGTLGNNAPFIGLFGTVLGIVGAFNKLKTNPEGGIDVVGGDLSEALVATAVGILVALPAVLAFNYFNRRVRSALSSADEVAHEVLGVLHTQAEKEDD
jgi:biopolymer transport protein ExbB